MATISTCSKTATATPIWPKGFLVTELLATRPWRDQDVPAEIRAMHDLARQMVTRSEGLFDRLVELAIELCGAGSAGVSLLEQTVDGDTIFRWRALAGHYKSYVGGFTPRDFSPCGICLDRNETILLRRPQRVFEYLDEAPPPIVEGLILPLCGNSGRPFGTIWIMSHDEERLFDAGTVEVMTRLTAFTALGLEMTDMLAEKDRLYRAAEHELAERKRAEERQSLLMRELDHRVRNIPATVQAVAGQTLKPSSERDRLQHRLTALAKVHSCWRTADGKG